MWPDLGNWPFCWMQTQRSSSLQEIAKSAFPHRFFLAMQNTENLVQSLWDFWGALIEQCGCSLQDIGLILWGVMCVAGTGMPLGVFLLTEHLLLISGTTPDITAMPIKASIIYHNKLSAMIRPLYLKLYLQCSPHGFTTNYNRDIMTWIFQIDDFHKILIVSFSKSSHIYFKNYANIL